MKNSKKTSRRRFLQAASIIGLGSFFAPAVLADKSPNSKLNIGVIGVGGRGAEDIGELVKSNRGVERFHAFCDVNATTLNKQSDKYKVEHRYQDYRKMFNEKAKELDAVMIASMDHTHGLIACTAMDLGLHCYCEKPLANSVWEIRLMAEFAKKKKLCTQTGTQVRAWGGAHYYRSFELIQAGAIGEVNEVYIWSDGTFVPSKKEDREPEGETPIPPDFDYDVWLGPVPFRPFNKAWLAHPGRFAFWHSSNGYLAQMGPHTVDTVWTALKLTPPETIEVDGPEPNPLYNPDKQHVTWTHRKPNGKELKFQWFDSGRRPEGLSEGIDPKKKQAIVFIGTEGLLQVHYDYHFLAPKEKFADYKVPTPTYPPSIGHQAQWIEAVKANKPEMCECNIEYAAPYTEAMVLAVNMHRAKVKKIKWDAEKMTTDSKEVNAYIKPTFRQGWDFPTP
ncbi:MAG: Gfo/Idh/MocA family oxidoreductase [Planctomycetaceae bacterium]|jgi:predicted dehydrogenase|nr:Gfo/Idh/MocA family oxidoreductase [Planctomycetaceae bacterium]